ncbi:hypothetical protein DFH06DRAFT_1150113 [Mycena polygramma]|nr:hypothetical protein DFH06DRAFT_1150113 [Mycena polygramma]
MSYNPYGSPAHPSAYQSNSPAYHPQAQYTQQGGVTTVAVKVRGTTHFRQSPNDPIHNYHESNPPSQSQHGWATNSPLPESGFSASQRMPQDQEYRVQRLSPHLALPYRPSRFLQHDWNIDFAKSRVDFDNALKVAAGERALRESLWDLLGITIRPEQHTCSIDIRDGGQCIDFRRLTKKEYAELSVAGLMYHVYHKLAEAWTVRTNAVRRFPAPLHGIKIKTDPESRGLIVVASFAPIAAEEHAYAIQNLEHYRNLDFSQDLDKFTKCLKSCAAACVLKDHVFDRRTAKNVNGKPLLLDYPDRNGTRCNLELRAPTVGETLGKLYHAINEAEIPLDKHIILRKICPADTNRPWAYVADIEQVHRSGSRKGQVTPKGAAIIAMLEESNAMVGRYI